MKYLLLACGILLVSCSKQNSNFSSDSTSSSVTSDSMATTNTPNTASSTTPTSTANMQMTDANIIAQLSEADSSEIVEAKYVMSKTKNAQVKSFAGMMVTDHTKMMKDKQQLAAKLNITPAPPANDPMPGTLQSEMSALQSATDSKAMDSMYIATAVQDHQKDLDDVRNLQTQAQSQELKDALKKAEPVIQKHYDHAKMMQDKMSNMASSKSAH